MGNTLMRFVQRRWLIILLFIIFMAGIVIIGQQSSPYSATSITPSKVIMKKAAVIDQGVQVEWLEAQANIHPISGYIVERSRYGNSFERIARVDKLFLDYLDADGYNGDMYRIIAEDSRQPAAQSPASEPVIAAIPKPGSVVVIAPALPQVLSASTAVSQAETPAAKVAVLQNLIAETFTAIDTALTNKNAVVARGHLHALQDYQRQALRLGPHLSLAEKASLAKICADKMTIFEVNMHVLPEDDQMDGMLVHAGCNAIQEQTE